MGARLRARDSLVLVALAVATGVLSFTTHFILRGVEVTSEPTAKDPARRKVQVRRTAVCLFAFLLEVAAVAFFIAGKSVFAFVALFVYSALYYKGCVFDAAQ